MSTTASARDLYLATAARVIDVAACGDWDLNERLRGCPEWTARDLLGHLTGITQDWVESRLDGYASTAWTDRQVARHRDESRDELLHAWTDALAGLSSVEPHAEMGEPWRWLFGDALTHEADLYESLDIDRRPPSEAVVVGLTGVIGRWRQVLAPVDEPPLEIIVPDVRNWWVGQPAANRVTLRVDAYDLWRFLYGRTSRRSVEEFAWSRDPAPYLEPGLPYPFHFPDGG